MRILTRFLVIGLALTFLGVAFHELGHALSAICFGVPLSKISFGIEGLSPVIYIDAVLSPALASIFLYSGGLLSSALLASLVSVVRGWEGRLAVITTSVLQGINGLVEGRFNSYYSASILSFNPMLSLYLSGIVLVVFFIYVHYYPWNEEKVNV